ncbi:MAG: anti-sigma regulatory factor (Ser/Thr protein kinase) [Chlamydiales bacterium]|jgi:anti-sigma regulatory factor (Ser/Thr protein kinase)
MNTAPRTALIVVADGESRLAMRWWLDREGFIVRSATHFNSALQMVPGDLLVTDLQFGEDSGFDLLRAYQQRGFQPWTLVLASPLGTVDAQQAMELGIRGRLDTPLDAEQFTRAMRGFRQQIQNTQSFVSVFDTTPVDIAQAPRDVAAFALRCGVGPACRARIAGVCADIIENVERHAYPHGTGQVELHVTFADHEFEVVVSDQGIGFDPVLVSTGCMSRALDGGIARATALSEDLRIESALGKGATIRARFVSSNVQFEDSDSVDLSDLDFLDPSTARKVLASLQYQEVADVYHLSPALAVIIGRLLVGPDPRRALQMAIRS